VTHLTRKSRDGIRTIGGVVVQRDLAGGINRAAIRSPRGERRRELGASRGCHVCLYFKRSAVGAKLNREAALEASTHQPDDQHHHANDQQRDRKVRAGPDGDRDAYEQNP
jgi:hypothetical protein